VILARFAMLLVAAGSVLAAFGAMAPLVPGSALRVGVTAVVGLLAPLLWPGRSTTPTRTALRIVAWSAAASVVAGVLIALVASGTQPWLPIVLACAMLMAILVLTHAAVAGLERRWTGSSEDSGGARELAGRAATLSLAALGTLPFWFGPAAELLAARYSAAIDIVVGASPLFHLAAASGNDLLRNSWFYEHSNFAVLPVAYPGLGALAWCYGSACLMLAIVALARLPRRGDDSTSTR
jgi:hypothetical protein